MKTIPPQRHWKLLRWLAITTIAVVPIWVSHGNIFGFTSVKSFLFMGFVSLMFLACGWIVWKEKNPLSVTWLHGVLILFVLALGSSAILGVNPHASWFGTFQHGTGAVYLFGFAAWAIILGVLVRRDIGFLYRVLQAAFISSVIVAVSTFFNTSGGLVGNSSYTGAYLLFCACIGIGLLWIQQSKYSKVLVAAGLLVIFFCPIFFNGQFLYKDNHSILNIVGDAQGAAFGLACSLVVMILIACMCSKKVVVRSISAALFVICIAGVWYGGSQFVNPDSRLHAWVVEEKTSNRFLFWNIAGAGLLERPFTGWGWGNYDRVFQTYFDPIIFTPGYAIEPSISNPHNIVWSYASETGIVGLISYLSLWGGSFIVLYQSARRNRDRTSRIFGTALAGALAGYLLQNMFIFDTPVVYLMYFSIIGIALGLAPAKELRLFNTKVTRSIVAVFLGVVGVTALVWLCILPWRESTAWTTRLSPTHDSEKPSPQKISLVGGAGDVSYIASKLYVRSKKQALSPAQKEFFTSKFTLFKDYLAVDADSGVAADYRPYVIKGVLENGLVSLSGVASPALLAAARSDFEQAIVLNPRSPEPYFNLVQTAVYAHEYDVAYRYLRAGIALASQYEQGYTIGEMLLKIRPNPSFARYLKLMGY